MFGEYQNTEPSRFIEEIPLDLVEQDLPAVSSSYSSGSRGSQWGEYRANPYGRPRQPAAGYRAGRQDDGAKVPTQNFKYEEEDQTPGLRPGARVKHTQFGSGTVVSVEDLEDDQKLVVRFNSVGTKTLRASLREAGTSLGSRIEDGRRQVFRQPVAFSQQHVRHIGS